jgi:hypothetical protein
VKHLTYAQQEENAMTKTRTPLRIVPLIHAGARRGAEALAPYLAAWNRESGMSLRPIYVDPVPGRAATMRDRARELALPAEAEEAAIEDYLAKGEQHEPRSVLLLSLDHPRSISRTLESSAGHPVLAYSMWQFPTGHLAGFQAVIAPADEATRRRLAALFLALGSLLTARAGSGAIFGEGADGANRVAEPMYRARIGAHLARNLPKLVAGLEPEDPAVELVMTASSPEATIIVESPRAWRSAADLLGEGAGSPIAPGQSLLILELGPDGLRVHRVRLRRVDRTVDFSTVTGTEPRMRERSDRRIQSKDLDRRALAALGLTMGALLLTD